MTEKVQDGTWWYNVSDDEMDDFVPVPFPPPEILKPSTPLEPEFVDTKTDA